MKQTTLRTWLEETGMDEGARLFKVDISTVRNWRAGRAVPRPPELAKIVKLSRGAVSYEEVIETFLRTQKLKKAKKN